MNCSLLPIQQSYRFNRPFYPSNIVSSLCRHFLLVGALILNKGTATMAEREPVNFSLRRINHLRPFIAAFNPTGLSWMLLLRHFSRWVAIINKIDEKSKHFFPLVTSLRKSGLCITELHLDVRLIV
ncbi:hypothetical protein CEXT_175461 [Caerostris extrusa]|uniref:Uncharacterized protein n=1 Tax=Caerostris extrusa TaxID=172846 RepID=A0AAV4V9K5_CAEEX|nr:hypothetical protein CEXT_175461 [Caerostris extrusa]